MAEYPAEELERWVMARLADLLGRDRADMDSTVPFASYGLRSVEAISLVGELEEHLGRPLSEAAVYEWPTPRQLARQLAGDVGGARARAVWTRPTQVLDSPAAWPGMPGGIAITGMACRFPGDADTPERFWELLATGGDAVGDAPVERWEVPPDEAAANARTVGAVSFRGGFVRDVAGWDAEFFGVSPREALRIDPQHRLLAEVVWEALEDAGLAPDRLAGSHTGVFVGLMDSQQYARLQFERDPGSAGDPSFALGTSPSVAAGRLSYLLDLHGPAVVVDTACSSSLVSLHLAAEAVRRGECDIAVVGGTSVVSHSQVHSQAQCMAMLSADGRCRAFDASADGYVLGEGCGAVVIERMPDALRAGRRIHATLLGSAVNQDGRSNGLTAPSRTAQVDVIRRALHAANAEPTQVDFVEAHGSGTRMGDTIELEALQEVFAGRTSDRPLWVGAVKTNVGHLLAAAGIAGFIKTVLAVEHGLAPPNLHLTIPNPSLERDPSIRPVSRSQELHGDGDRPLLAGVSSFGWSGTNAHAVVQQVPPSNPAPVPGGTQLLTVSAATATALRQAAGELARFLDGRDDLELADVARTLREGRSRFRFRAALVCRDLEDAARQLRAIARGGAPTQAIDGPAAARPQRPSALLGTGGGTLASLAGELYVSSPSFRESMDRCLKALPSEHADAVADRLRSGPRQPADPGTRRGRPTPAEGLELLPARSALAELLSAPGVNDDVLLETGFGECVTAALAGALRPGPGGVDRERLLLWVARLWELGLEPDWEALGQSGGGIVSLPHYPFQRAHLWPEPPVAAAGPPLPLGRASSSRRPPEQWCYAPQWHPTPSSAGPGGEGQASLRPGVAVLLGDDLGVVASLGRRLRAAGHRVLVVDRANGLTCGSDRAGIDPADPGQYRRLLQEVQQRAEDGGLGGPVRLVHAWSLGVPPVLPPRPSATPVADVQRRLADTLRLGFHSVMLLAQAAGESLLRGEVRLLVVTGGAVGVTAPDGIAPEQATVNGLCHVLEQEYELLRCHAVDLDPRCGDTEQAGNQLWHELARLDDARATEPQERRAVAWRSGRRWERRWEPVHLGDLSPDRQPAKGWRPDGAYLITGGTRGLGMALARHLARTGCRRLALVGRTQLPHRRQWDDWLADHGAGDPVSQVLRDVRELERLGSEVLTITADVGDVGQLQRALRRARGHFGALHGVVHAAGVPGRGLIQSKSVDEADAVLRPKVHGALPILEELGELEFVVLYSSAVSAIGGLGEGDYCAANAFLDACASSMRAAGSSARLLSVAWGPWRHDDWNRGGRERDGLSAATAAYRERYGIGDDEGAELLTRILASPLREVLVLPQPLPQAVRWWADLGGALRRPTGAPAGGQPLHPRPQLRTPYVPPRNALEERIAQVWQEHLGIDQVGASDPFFELGGTSLIALAMVARLERELATVVPAALLFARPTVRELAAALGDTSAGADESYESKAAASGTARGARRLARGAGRPTQRSR